MINKNIFEAIVNEFGCDYTIKEQSITKNNGVVMNGVLVTEGDSNVGMCIYLDGIDTEEEAIKIVRSAIDNGIEEARRLRREMDPAKLFSRDNLLDKVYPVLVNREKNTNDDVIKSKFHDLDVIYKMDIEMKDGFGEVTITKQLLQFSDVGIATMHRQALKNIKGKGIIMDLEQKIFSIVTGEKIETPRAGEIMNIVTNKDFKFGAAMLLDDDMIAKLSELYHGSFFVLPLNINEVITIPCTDGDDANALVDMVKSINAENVSEEKFLSNSVYRYSDGKFDVVS